MRTLRESLFDLGLLAFPRSFRTEYGSEMREVARERLGELGFLETITEVADATIAGTRMRFEHMNAAMPALLAGVAMIATAFAMNDASFWRRDPAGRLDFNAQDPAGAFTLTVLNGKPIAATLDRVPLSLSRLVATSDTIRILKPDGAVELAIAFDRETGSIAWAPRAPRR
ncbi:MAG TPA: hypothetical protein VFD22_05200 [Gemmatimonadaceae bacterium]|nr:hypothetical protein [Gemmatimonadaceae bacterium]